MVLGPDFLIIGAARSGTTALASFLGEHPDVFMASPKEPHFLAFAQAPPHFRGPGDDVLVNRHAVRGGEHWLALFRDAPERRRGEGSVTTLCFPHTSLPAIERWCAEDCRLVAVLRDPVDRAFSSWLYLQSRGYDAGTFEQGLAAEEARTREGWSHMWQFARLSRYAEQLEPFVEWFGDRLLVVVQEELVADPHGQFRRVLAFLDVDPEVDVDPTRRVNEGGLPRSRTATLAFNATRRVPGAQRLVKAVVPERRRERLRSAAVHRPALDPRTRSALAESLSDDVRRLERLLDRDLSLWPSA